MLSRALAGRVAPSLHDRFTPLLISVLLVHPMVRIDRDTVELKLEQQHGDRHYDQRRVLLFATLRLLQRNGQTEAVLDDARRALTCATRVLRTAYDTWAQEEGIRHPLTSKALSERLQARSATQTRLHGGDRAWRGVGVRVQTRDTTQPGDKGDVGDRNSGKSSHARADEESYGSAVTPVTHVTGPGF